MAIPYSQTVANQQAALNAANFGKTPGYTALKVDGLLGNLTQSAFDTYGVPKLNTPTTAGAIPVDNLGATPPSMKMPTAPVVPSTAGFSGFMDAVGTQFKTTAESQTQTGINQQQDTIAQLMLELGDESKVKDQAYKDAGVDTAKKSLDDFEKQLEREQLRNRREVEAMLGSGAITKEQAAPQIEGLNRQSLAKQADIAILKAGASRDYATAIDIADRAVEAKMAPMKARLDAFKFIYDNNKEAFTRADDQRLKKEYARYQSQLNLEEYRAKSKIDAAALSNGDTLAASAPKTYTLVAGDDPYNIAQTAGIDMAELQRLNPAVKDWKNLPVGFKLNMPTTNLQGQQNALNVILASGKFTKEQKQSLIQGLNSGGNALAIVKNQAKNIMGSAAANDLGKAETAKEKIEDIDSLLKQYYREGGSTNLFSGKYENVVNNLGRVKDPALVGIASQIALAMQEYRLAVTGTAASVQEDARIDNVFPGITNGEVLNNVRTQALLNSFNKTIDSTYENVLGQSYYQLKGTPQGGSVFNNIQIPGVQSFSFGGVSL